MKVISRNKVDTFIEKLYLRREIENYDTSTQVLKIILDVKKRGDAALKDYTLKYDEVLVENLQVSQEEIRVAKENINKELYESLIEAKDNIEEYHKMQIRESKFMRKEGIKVGELISALKNVGIYVPGGKASYPSTVLMNAVPAKLAGVKSIVMVTPPQKDGRIKDSVLVAADLAGVDKIYKVGGAHSISALAYGTSSIDAVNKIVGPGNIFVATAKKLVAGKVGIDMIAGPSEILILADKSSHVDFIAADMIAQAEHDERAAAICITTDKSMVKKLQVILSERAESSERKEIIKSALKNYGAIIEADNLDVAVDIANRIAPEHLEIMTENPDDICKRIDSAGAIFIGDYSPEALGDYFAGPNHTLPTSGTARFSSPLGIDDFIKKTSYIRYERKALKDVGQKIMKIANDEGLFGHANSIKLRLEEK